MFEEMMQAGFTPCVTTYNAFLNVLARKGEWRAAESITLDMKRKGFKPNDTSYSSMIQCYAKGGNIKGIQRIENANFKCRTLPGMQRAFKELQKSGYKPYLVVYNSMLSIFARN